MKKFLLKNGRKKTIQKKILIGDLNLNFDFDFNFSLNTKRKDMYFDTMLQSMAKLLDILRMKKRRNNLSPEAFVFDSQAHLLM